MWVNFGKNSNEFFKDQVDSIYFDEQALIQRSFMDTTNFNLGDFVDKGTDSFFLGT
jgi:hypothetical protein